MNPECGGECDGAEQHGGEIQAGVDKEGVEEGCTACEDIIQKEGGQGFTGKYTTTGWDQS